MPPEGETLQQILSPEFEQLKKGDENERRSFQYTVKKRLAIFPSGVSLSKLSLAGNNLIIPTQGEFGK
jgi:hypothetical protein